MAAQTTYPLSLNGDTFNALKSDYDALLRQLLTEMENRDEEEATITIKVVVKLEKDQARDFRANGYDAMRDIVKPTFKHEISTVMQIKNKKSGSLGGTMEMVWDKELGQYVMRPIDNGQVSMFDEPESRDAGVIEPQNNALPAPKAPALPGPSGDVVDVEYKVVEDGQDDSDSRHADPKVLFEYMKQFIGVKMEVSESDGQYTVSTLDGKVILSSACHPTDRFYCSPQKLAPHVGHAIVCVGYGQGDIVNVSIECEDCNEVLFDIDAPADEPEDKTDNDKELLDTFNWLLSFDGSVMKVLEAMGNYTVRTESNKVILTSANPNTLLYCSGTILGPHVGHRLVCKSSGTVDDNPDTISIICEECEETLFMLHSPAWVYEEEIEGDANGSQDEDDPGGYPYEEPGEEG